MEVDGGCVIVYGTVYWFVYRFVTEGVVLATTRISDSDRALLQQLAAQTGKQHQELIHEALEAFHRDLLLDGINAAFQRLKSDESAWREEQQERAAWDGVAADGVASDMLHEERVAADRVNNE